MKKMTLTLLLAFASSGVFAQSAYFETMADCWIGDSGHCATSEEAARAQVAPSSVPAPKASSIEVDLVYFETMAGCWIGASGHCATSEEAARAQVAPKS